MRLGEEGERGEQECQDGPWAETGEQHRKARDRDQMTRQRDAMREHLKRAPARVLSRALQHVEKLRLLEVADGEPLRFVSHEQVDFERELPAENLGEVANRLTRNELQRDEHSLNADPEDGAVHSHHIAI